MSYLVKTGQNRPKFCILYAKKVRQLEIGTLPPLVVVVTNISYTLIPKCLTKPKIAKIQKSVICSKFHYKHFPTIYYAQTPRFGRGIYKINERIRIKKRYPPFNRKIPSWLAQSVLTSKCAGLNFCMQKCVWAKFHSADK